MSEEVDLKSFYTELYGKKGKKDDSPNLSRTSMARRIRELILKDEIYPNKILNIGSGPQVLEQQLLSKSQGNQNNRLNRKTKFLTFDIASIIYPDLLAVKKKNVHHSQGSSIHLPFKDKSFGLVVSNHAIDMCPRQESFSEAYRVLSTGGKGIFYLHHPSMMRNSDNDLGIVVGHWRYLRENKIFFETENEIKIFLNRIGFYVSGISLKEERDIVGDPQDKWWEVCVEK